MICRSMYATNRDRIELKIPSESVIHADSIRYSYIQLCTILDELKILSSFAKNNLYLRDTLYVISPAVRAIKKFNGIRTARNYMLAHFNRDKQKNFYPWWIALKEMKLPRTKGDLSQIYTYLNVINGIIVTRYYNDLKEFSQISKKEVDLYVIWMLEQEEKSIKHPTSFVDIENEIEKRMKEMNITGIAIDPFMKEVIEDIKKETMANTS